jgi:uncharacterized membrane protein
MKFIKQTSSSENAFAALKNLIILMDLPVQESFVEEVLRHSEYPSLTAISDTLKKIDIDSMAVEIGTDKLSEVPFPAIAHLHKNSGHFITVEKIEKGVVHLIDPEKGKLSQTIGEFENSWSGILLIVSVSGHANQRYQQKKRILKSSTLTKRIGLCLIVLNLLAPIVLMPYEFDVLYGLSLAGILFSVLLFQKQLGIQNSALNKFCQLGSTSNCDAVINSPYGKIFGVHISELSICYFIGFVFSLTISTYSTLSVESILFWFSAIALPVCLVSIYFQGIVIKQWCPLCLLIVLILILDFAVQLPDFNDFPHITVSSFIIVAFAFSIPFSVWFLLRSQILSAYKAHETEKRLNRFLGNDQIFRLLLNSQPKNNMSLFFKDIFSGEQDAPIELTIISKPTCLPCGYAHSIAEQLQNDLNGRLKITYRFTVPAQDKQSISYQMLSHIYSIDSNHKAFAAIRDWYTENGYENIEQWKSRHPKDSDLSLEEIDKIIKTQSRWCAALKVIQTPTLLINSRRLPDEYSLNDLTFHLKLLAEYREENEVLTDE